MFTVPAPPENPASPAVPYLVDEATLRRFLEECLPPDGREGAALSLDGSVRGPAGLTVLSHAPRFLREDDYETRSPVAVTLRPESAIAFLDALEAGPANVATHVHSHPFASIARFSAIDDAFDRSRAEAVCGVWREGDGIYCSIVITATDMLGRVFDPAVGEWRPLDVVQIGPNGIRHVGRPDQDEPSSEARLSRQAPVLGRSGQARLGNAVVAIVGVSGLGLWLAQSLALAGVRKLILVDPDRVTDDVRNRCPFPAESLGRAKAEAARDLLTRTLFPDFDLSVDALVATAEEVAAHLASLGPHGVIALAVDNDAARRFCNALAARYRVPLLDAASGIFLEKGQLRAQGGHVRLFLPGVPGHPCLSCMGLPSAGESGRVPYVTAADPQAPAFDPSTVAVSMPTAAMAASVLVGWLSGCTTPPAMVVGDLRTMEWSPVQCAARPDCPVCGPSRGCLGLGDCHPRVSLEACFGGRP